MSGLEIVGLIAGMVGATVGGVSAVKDVRKDKAIQKSCEVRQTRNMLQITEKACVTTGGGQAGITKTGDMYASSHGSGTAMAIFGTESRKW